MVRVDWTQMRHLLSFLLFNSCCFIQYNLSAAINSRKPRPTAAEAIKQAVVEEWDALAVDDYE